METKARRAEAKATLPEDSELMDFYNLADRAAWADEVNEESKREWADMSEEEKLERIPELISHTGWRDIRKKNGSIDWDMASDAWLGMRENDAMENAPTSETFFEDARIVSSPTLIRFTNYPPTDGIFLGHGPSNLGLTVHESRPGHGDLAFAFNVKELKTPRDWKSAQSKYGKHIFKFKVPYAVEADHISDGERQTVFDVNTVQDLKEIDLPKPTRREELRELLEDIRTMDVSDMLKLQESASFPQTDAISKAFNKRRKELIAQEKRSKKMMEKVYKRMEERGERMKREGTI